MTLRFMLWNQLRFLRDQGYEVHAVCSPGKWIADLEKERIRVKVMRIPRRLSPLQDLRFFFEIFFYFMKERFDLVHVHTLKPELYGQIAARVAGVKIVFNTIHGFDFTSEDLFLKKQFFLTIQRTAGLCSTKIFSISRTVTQEVQKWRIAPCSKMVYLGRDIDAHRFDPSKYSKESVETKKTSFGIPSSSPVVGIVARLVKEKGFLELFEAWKEIIRSFPDAFLLVAGPFEPEKRDALEPHILDEYDIKEKVIFLGERIDTEELYPLMDIFVLPTHREGLGATLLEASAMERPVVSCRVGGVPEAVEDGVTGLLVPPKNSKKLAEAIISLLGDPKRREEMGKAGRAKILREFSKEIVLERLGKVYNQYLPL